MENGFIESFNGGCGADEAELRAGLDGPKLLWLARADNPVAKTPTRFSPTQIRRTSVQRTLYKYIVRKIGPRLGLVVSEMTVSLSRDDEGQVEGLRYN